MDVSYVCQAASAQRPNDDFVLAAERFVIVLDGATTPVGVESGCIHDVPWLVAHLATNFASVLVREPHAALADVLRQGIVATMVDRARECDLRNPDSPSSTVAILRCTAESVDYVVLGDSAVVIEHGDGRLTVAHDDRTSYLSDYSIGGASRLRNTDEGFWIASNRPEAADKAIAGSVPLADVTRAALMTDGVTRLVERYGRLWLDVLERMDKCGPAQLVADVRAEELATPPGAYRGKLHDDVPAAFHRLQRRASPPSGSPLGYREAMLVTNHVLSGAVIGAAVRRPVPAFAVGVASHFVLDSMPHWGKWDNDRHFLYVAVADGLTGLAAMGVTTRGVLRTPAADRTKLATSVVLGMVGAALPDMDKPAHIFFKRKLWPDAVNRFHGRIQDEAPHRFVSHELVAAAGFALSAAALIKLRGVRGARV